MDTEVLDPGLHFSLKVDFSLNNVGNGIPSISATITVFYASYEHLIFLACLN
jgi:hypothetical protein